MTMSTYEKAIAEAEIAARILVALIENSPSFRNGNAATDARNVAESFKTIHEKVKGCVGA